MYHHHFFHHATTIHFLFGCQPREIIINKTPARTASLLSSSKKKGDASSKNKHLVALLFFLLLFLARRCSLLMVVGVTYMWNESTCAREENDTLLLDCIFLAANYDIQALWHASEEGKKKEKKKKVMFSARHVAPWGRLPRKMSASHCCLVRKVCDCAHVARGACTCVRVYVCRCLHVVPLQLRH